MNLPKKTKPSPVAQYKEYTCNAGVVGDAGFDPWVVKIPWRRAWQPTLYSCLENPMDRGAWKATIHGVTKSWTRLRQLSKHTHKGAKDLYSENSKMQMKWEKARVGCFERTASKHVYYL